MTVGRPTKFTQENRDKILYAIEKGATYELACNYARVSISIFCEWRAEAKKDPTSKYAEFLEDLKVAEGAAAVKWLDVIDKAMKKEWTPAAWKLERRHYKDYSANPMVRAEIKELEERLIKLEKSKEGEKQNGNEAEDVDKECD